MSFIGHFKPPKKLLIPIPGDLVLELGTSTHNINFLGYESYIDGLTCFLSICSQNNQFLGAQHVISVASEYVKRQV